MIDNGGAASTAGSAAPGIRFGILGPLEVVDGAGAPAEIGGPRLRVLLTALLLDAGRVVTSERLIDDLWEGDAPSGAVNALQSLVSRLRRSLPAAHRPLIESHQVGYRLTADRASVDAHHFTALAECGKRELASGDAASAAATLRSALELWRGPAFVDAAGHEFARAAAVRYDQTRGACVDDRVEADLALGRAGELVAELEALVAAEPLRERRRGQLMRALYAAGRQADALGVYDQTRRVLSEQLGVDPSPELERIHLAVLRHDPSLAAEEPPAHREPAPVRTARTNLRAQLTSFVGRDGEVVDIGDALKDNRLVTLTGPGGAGKTRLATEVGARLADTTPDGVWLVPLAPVRDPADVPHVVLATLGLRERALVPSGLTVPLPPADATDRLVAALSTGRALIMLDNCEHVIDAVAVLADRVLAACPDVQVLATSREPLGITGERLWPVPPLGMPPADVTAEHAREYPSVRLLAERARAVRPDFTIDDGNVAAVAAICRSLDGMPLAIELAAARMRAMSPAQVAERLGDRFRLLTGGSRTALPRHQTLRAVVEWSWDLLTGAERTLARRLSVFGGGATLAAAEQVCAGEGLAAYEVVDALAGLVDKSLVEMDAAPDGGELRYRMLETVRAYGAEMLAAAGEDTGVGAAHTRYFLRLLTDAEPRLRTADQLRWLGVLDAEQGNITAAMRRSVAAGDAETALRLLAGGCWYWLVRGRGTELRTWVGPLTDLVGDAPPPGLGGAYAILRLASLDEEAGLAAFRDRARELLQMRDAAPEEFGWPMFRLLDLVEPLFDRNREAGVAVAERLAGDADPWIAALSWLARAIVTANFGRLPASEEHFRTAIAKFRALGERFGLVQALSSYCEPLTTRGAHDDAIAALAEAAEASAELSGRVDPHLSARLAYVRIRAGDLAGAEADLAAWSTGMDGQENADEALYGEYVRIELSRAMGDLTRAHTELAAARERMSDPPRFGPEAMMSGLLDIVGTGLAITEGDADTALRDAVSGVRRMTFVPTHDMPMAATAVECLAGATLAAGDARRAAELIGAAERARGMTDIGSDDVLAAIAGARAALGDAAYDEALARGRTWSLDDVRATLPAEPS
ncbi:MAG TPA: BTAD domain-containing putative transcriptional regulator [Streptosporangiaceae bacterium]|jgi:predicted ATPase/DNA-binding SARP family transcriptional activator